MPLEVQLMEEEDAPAFATIDGLAMADWATGQAMVLAMSSEGENRHDVIERWMRQDFRNNSEMVWLKVVDTELENEIIACALWRFALSGDSPKIEAPAPVQEVEVKKDEQKPTIWSALEQSWNAFRAEFVGSSPHANLQICIVHPEQQRRGAGSMLVKWGCDKADERGLTCILGASEAGLKLYKNFGFEIVKLTTMDLRPFGVDATELRRGMVRPAKPKQS
ncbi:hypothetical protein LTR97_009645 [Elasticomyces elasticus]|uniref:N-acetyltransferase domain-containing protein n=1 Tax=Elasticomyces elasticus TaxID=574655 RepID=A0AAN7W4R0_9PEZI|nr:hypothetical protein LTR97_009645 [Elasticomyces elasticus]KAK5722431.1 hypothetical protein LTR15_005661 [Elasticomyces elasticus]